MGRATRSKRARRIVQKAAGSPLKHKLVVKGGLDETLPSDERIELAMTAWREADEPPKKSRKKPTERMKFDAHVREVMAERAEKTRRCLVDDDYRREENRKCKADVVYWLTYYGWTLDPRLQKGKDGVFRPTLLPFVPFEKQVEYLRYLEQLENDQSDGIAEKSREVGFTWLSLAFMIHRWLFIPGWKGAVGSRKEDLVDKLGDPDSILEKARILIRLLPHWMRPLGYEERTHARFMQIVNPANTSVITGEAGLNIGRGGRNSFYLIDEAAHLQQSSVIDAALSFNSPCKVFVSTPNGMGNTFAMKRHSGNYPVFTFHWTADPRKDKAWYKAQCKKYEHDTVLIAQELDIDYTASQEGIMIPAAWVRAAVDHDVGKAKKTDLKRLGFDVAGGGKNKSVAIGRVGSKAGVPQDTREKNTTKQTRWVDDIARQLGVDELAFDTNGLGLGIASTLEEMGEDSEADTPIVRTIHADSWTSPLLPYRVVPVQSGATPGDEQWPDGKTSRQKFLNRRAVGYWRLRVRFEKTYEHVNEIAEHPADERISIPNHQTLITQLSMPCYVRLETGKTKVESKEAMKKRGVQSPDYADALMFAFDVEPTTGWHDYAKQMAAQARQTDGDSTDDSEVA